MGRPKGPTGKAKLYTVYLRSDKKTWELRIDDRYGLGLKLYGGRFKSLAEALESLEKNWGIKPSEKDLHTSLVEKQGQ